MFPDGSDALLVCKRDGWRNVDAFTMNSKDPNDYRPIRYDKFKKGAPLRAKISKDLNSIFLNTGKESILLKGSKQSVLKWFKQKHVLKILTVHDGFIGIACNEYDVEIDLLHTNNEKVKFHIPRK